MAAGPQDPDRCGGVFQRHGDHSRRRPPTKRRPLHYGSVI